MLTSPVESPDSYRLIGLIVNLFIGIALGANVVIANAIGCRDDNAVKRAVHTAIVFAVCGGAAVALLAVLGPFDVLRSASSLHVCMALAAAMMTGGVLDLVFWVLDPFGWKNEG